MVTTKERLQRQEECVGGKFEHLTVKMAEVNPGGCNRLWREQRCVRRQLANLRMMIEQLEDLSDDDVGPEIPDHDDAGPLPERPGDRGAHHQRYDGQETYLRIVEEQSFYRRRMETIRTFWLNREKHRANKDKFVFGDKVRINRDTNTSLQGRVGMVIGTTSRGVYVLLGHDSECCLRLNRTISRVE